MSDYYNMVVRRTTGVRERNIEISPQTQTMMEYARRFKRCECS
jgi:hypothetical protein